MRICECDKPSTTTLVVHYSYPRIEYLPEAMDPWRVHGGGYHIYTCGEPGCEAEAYNASREQIIEGQLRQGLLPEQIADTEIEIYMPGDSSAYGFM